MSMNVDMLNMLNTNKVNNNASSQNNNVDTKDGQGSFLDILNNAIYGNSTSSTNHDLLNSIIENSEDEDKTQNNDLLASLLLMMQQSIQGNYVDYDNLLSSVNNSDSFNIDSINNVIQNLQSTTNLSYENLEGLLSGLQNQNTQQSNNNINQPENQQLLAVTEDLYAGRSFPKEIMESINAARQAHDLIRSKIEQTRSITGEAKPSSNEGTLTTEKSNQNIQISVIENANNSVQISNSSNIEEKVIVNTTQLDSDLASEANGVNKELLSSKKELSNNSISEGLLNVNGIDIQNNSKIVKINDESSLIKESVMSQIKDQIVLMKSDGKQTVTMQLTPENLGKLDIKMVFEKGNLSVEILASNPKAHSLILSNISELKSILQNSIADRTFMNVDNQKNMYEHNQNNQGHSQQQERNDSNEREYQPTYADISDNDEGIDFLTELTRLRDYRFGTVSEL